MARLLQWSSRLERVLISRSSSRMLNPDFRKYSKLHSLLLYQRESLASIKICSEQLCGASDGYYFDSTMFPNLKMLQLCRLGFPKRLTFRAKDKNFVGSNMRLFGWDFGHRTHYRTVAQFGEQEGRWLRSLVDWVIAQQMPLRTVEIGNNWRIDIPSVTRLVRLQHQLTRPNGLELIWMRDPWNRGVQ